jgi:hypothetical protein
MMNILFIAWLGHQVGLTQKETMVFAPYSMHSAWRAIILVETDETMVEIWSRMQG